MTKTILPLIVLASAVSLGCASPGVDDDAPESVASVAQATVYTPVLDSGFSHSCAGKSDGTMYCWGYNWSGQLGDGTSVDRSTPVLATGITGPISIATGENHTCVVDSTSAVYCWGFNGNGKLGDGTFVDHRAPAPVLLSVGGSALTGAVSVVAGHDHNCVLTSGGGVSCWGTNLHGQLGDGTTTRRLTPVSVRTSALSATPLSGVVAIGTGPLHACAVKSSGEVWCWGDDTSGQLGDGLTTNTSWPVQVVGITNAIAVTAGSGHSCALLSTGAIKCWGQAYQGQLGDGATPFSQPSPVSVSGISTAVSISAGPFHTCAVLADQTGRCWGSNGYRYLGDGTTTQRNTPVVVSGLIDGISVSAGLYSVCALRSGGGVKCWGINNLGNLGVGTTTVNTWPVDVLGLP